MEGEEYVGFFLSSALEEKICGSYQLQHLRDPQVPFWILTRVFPKRPSYLLRSCLSTLAFLEYLEEYDIVLWQIAGSSGGEE